MNSAQPIRPLISIFAATLLVAACSTLSSRDGTPSQPAGTNAPPPSRPTGGDAPDDTASDALQGEDSSSAESSADPTNGARLWDALRARMRLPTYSDRADVQREIQVLRHDRGLPEILRTRGARWLPMIADEARRRDLPGEVVMLAYIESKLNPDANHAGNVGMWQIRADTARILGLRIGDRSGAGDLGNARDHSNDERRDPLKSTSAAMGYLQRLTHSHGGDVMLALVAYNIGDGSLARAQNAAPGAKDIWALPLSASARSHIARLAAMWSIVRTPQRYGITLPSIASTGPMADVVRTQARRSAVFFNAPAPMPRVQGASDSPTKASGGEARSQPLAGITGGFPLRDDRRSHRQRAQYAVMRGDTLHSIARRHGTSPEALRRANRLASNLIHPGEELIIPRDY